MSYSFIGRQHHVAKKANLDCISGEMECGSEKERVLLSSLLATWSGTSYFNCPLHYRKNVENKY